MPRALTEEQETTLLNVIECGVEPARAAVSLGLSASVVCQKSKRNADFAARVEAAKAKALVFYLSRIRVAAEKGDWCAAAWMAERLAPEYTKPIDAARIAAIKAEIPAPESSSSGPDPRFL